MKQPCKNCFYAIYDGQTQTGCQFNRMDKFFEQGRVVEAYDEDKEFYVIEGGCNAYNEWKYITPEEAKPYLTIPYELIISSNNIQLIKQSLQYHVSVNPKKVRVMYSGPENIEERKYIIQTYNCLFTQLLSEYSVEQLSYEGIKQVRSLFYIVLEDGEVLHDQFITQCEKLYNEDLKLFDMVEGSNRLVRTATRIYDLDEYKKEFPDKCLSV